MLTHINDAQQPTMVDISAKAVTARTARARAIVTLGPEIMGLLAGGDLPSKKGPVFQTAIIAGTMAAKRTAELIPFCHTMALEDCRLTIAPLNDREVVIECSVAIQHRTGVEMEALTGASVAALTIYDMCKARSHDIVIRDLRLLEKHGGKHDYLAPTGA